MDPHQQAIALAAWISTKDLNEADTRHQIIDVLMHKVLLWPVEAVKCEKSVCQGYIDYVLVDGNGKMILVIEAKKEGASFELPNNLSKHRSRLHRVKLSKLMTDDSIKGAISQVVGYATTSGARFAAVTNGHVYIVFQAFIPGRDYREAEAIVIPSLDFFAKSFVEAENLLSYIAIVDNYSLFAALGESHILTRDFFHPKDGVDHYDAPLRKNEYARFLDPLARRYFSEISINDRHLMEKCYVYASGADVTELGIKSQVIDLITPFLLADGGVQIESRRTGGALTNRIAAALSEKESEVLILFGGKGAGKSTFLRRLFYYETPTEFQIHLFPIIIDLLQAPQKESALTELMWGRIVASLDLDGVMQGDIEGLSLLFADRMSVAEKQDLYPYDGGSIEYKIKRTELISSWKADLVYVAKALLAYWKNRGKGVAIAFDNTDQMPPALQDHCFLQAQSIAAELGCIALISMREERYCRARTMGVLDAYYNIGFHLSSPNLILVFQKRLKFLLDELNNPYSDARRIVSDANAVEPLTKFFRICQKQFRDENNALTRFLRECSRANTRLALDFFRQYMTSGYTNVDEMIVHPGWTVSNHQVIKPMMIPERFNYDESKSIVPNLFQCRNARFGSHFTSLRILAKLRHGLKAGVDKAGYKRINALIDEFERDFRMKGDFISCVDVLLQHGMVEANNGLDTYSVEGANGQNIYADEVRITAFGVYASEFLIGAFVYLDLVSMDCGLSSQTLYSQFCSSARGELEFAVNKNRGELLKLRIERVENFVSYLAEEEAREAAEFNIDPANLFMPSVKSHLDEDLRKVRKSAGRNLRNDGKGDLDQFLDMLDRM